MADVPPGSCDVGSDMDCNWLVIDEPFGDVDEIADL